MHIEQIYTKCLAQGAYYIRSQGEAVIIDPLRESSPYLERLEKDGVALKYIFETHFHADFVSGHVSLAEKTGAKIIYGPEAKTSYISYNAVDGETYKVGDITIKALHTPGHTLESTCYLLLDADNKPHCVFTGDTLFLGDVGRPDLCQKGADITEEDLASMLYDSLRSKLMPLPDDVLIYPAHGAGSACGKNMMNITVDSLGNQRESNYALRADMTKQEFIKEVTEGLTSAPAYFPLNVSLNKEGYEHLEDILVRGTSKLSPAEFDASRKHDDVLVLDVRSKEDYATGHVPKSIFIGLDGSFAPWVGAILKNTNQKLLLVTPEGREEETVTRLSRVGFDNTLGYLNGGLTAWQSAGNPISMVEEINADVLLNKMSSQDTSVIDARKPGEYSSSHVANVKSLPLSQISDRINEIPDQVPTYVHCQSGYRSLIASSVVMAQSNKKVINVLGGYNALVANGALLEEQACSHS